MAYAKYTRCYDYLTTRKKPFRESELLSFVLGAGGLGLGAVVFGLLTGIPVVAGIGMAFAVASIINEVAEKYLYGRLVCLTGKKCAIGTVAEEPHYSDLGKFDNDEYFDLVLMPHRPEDKTGPPGEASPEQHEHPKNYVHSDGLMGQELLTPITQSSGLPYDLSEPEAYMLHCEAEGYLWPLLRDLRWWLGGIMGVASGLGAAAAVAIVASCTFSGLFFFICLLIAFIAYLLITASGAAIVVGIIKIIFEASKGNVEDANVGDKSLGPIKAGDRIVVLGEHVYDGFHEGWNEFHPLMKVVKLNSEESSQYLEWNYYARIGGQQLPEDTDDMNMEIRNLSVDDMSQGLNSDKFKMRAKWLRDKYCKMVQESDDPATHEEQSKPKNRWTVHPDVDGCVELIG